MKSIWEKGVQFGVEVGTRQRTSLSTPIQPRLSLCPHCHDIFIKTGNHKSLVERAIFPPFDCKFCGEPVEKRDISSQRAFTVIYKFSCARSIPILPIVVDAVNKVRSRKIDIRNHCIPHLNSSDLSASFVLAPVSAAQGRLHARRVPETSYPLWPSEHLDLQATNNKRPHPNKRPRTNRDS
jgi:hypothetical protein